MKKVIPLNYSMTASLLEHLVSGSTILLQAAVDTKCPQSFCDELSQAVASLLNCQRIIGVAVLDQLSEGL